MASPATDPHAIAVAGPGWVGLAVAVIIAGYVFVIVSWAWHRLHADDVDQDAVDAARRLRRELRGHDERNDP